MSFEGTVYVVDDDESVRRSLRWLMESAHFAVETFASGELFLERYDPSGPACLILDLRMPGISGLDVQRMLIEKNCKLPVIVMTGHGDVPACSRAFKYGAFDFIEKPADDQVLIDVIQKALAADTRRQQLNQSNQTIRSKLAELTPREAEVMALIVSGKTQKQIAAQLEIGVQTAAKHRARILEKLGVSNDVELTKLVSAASAPSQP